MGSSVAELAVTVNGKRYTIGCADGEERHVARLAADIDRRVAALVRSVGAVGDARLLLMAALLMGDELDELRRGGGAAVAGTGSGEGERTAAAIEALALRIEAVAGRLEAP
jgi:cell division protein ZapA